MFAEHNEQSDLFGVPTAKAYVPDPSHVRNRLDALLAEMVSNETWPWDASIVSLHRERTFSYLCGLLPEAEGDEWRARIDRQVSRLDAASAVVPSLAAE